MAGVLVVVEDDAVRTLIGDVLEILGHTVTEEEDSHRAAITLRVSDHPLVVVARLHLGWPEPNPMLAALTADVSLASRHSFIWLYASTLDDAERLTPSIGPYRSRFLEMPFRTDELAGLVAEAASTLPAW